MTFGVSVSDSKDCRTFCFVLFCQAFLCIFDDVSIAQLDGLLDCHTSLQVSSDVPDLWQSRLIILNIITDYKE